MKLRIVPASAGIQWVKLGIRTFFRQPLAMSGLFLLFLALMSLLSLIPVIGNVVALAILPGASLGLMAATEQATQGKFPMPAIMLSAFRAGRVQLRSMLVRRRVSAGAGHFGHARWRPVCPALPVWRRTQPGHRGGPRL